MSKKNEVQTDFIDSYTLDWTLEDFEGNRWTEHMNNMSLSDFEVLYGNTTYHIVELHLKQIKPEKEGDLNGTSTGSDNVYQWG